MGGEWSDEFVYNHQQIAAPVIAHIPSAYSTVDTISLRVQNSREDATYTWNIPHGKIISASANNDQIDVVFDKAGELKVGVQMSFDGKLYNAQDVTFLLSPAKAPTIDIPSHYYALFWI